MSQAQPWALLLPQTPMPVVTTWVTETTRRPTSDSEIAIAMYQALGGLGISATQATSLVTDRNAARASPSGPWAPCSVASAVDIGLEARVGVAHAGQVMRPRLGVELAEQLVLPAILGLQPADPAGLVV